MKILKNLSILISILFTFGGQAEAANYNSTISLIYENYNTGEEINATQNSLVETMTRYLMECLSKGLTGSALVSAMQEEGNKYLAEDYKWKFTVSLSGDQITFGCTNRAIVTYKIGGSVTYSWYEGNWVGCDNGIQKRSVYCQSSGSKKVADSNCSGTKPEASRTCTVSRKTGDWSTCSGGTQKRTVSCRDGYGLTAYSCTGTKPETSRTCTSTEPTTPPSTPPPIPPEPVRGSNDSTQSCNVSYTCGRTPNRTNCEVNMGTKTCFQEVTSYTPVTCLVTGYQNCSTPTEDGEPSGPTVCSGPCYPTSSYTPINPPSRPYPTNKPNLIFSVDTNFSSNTQVYANNTDQYRIDVRVSPDSSVNGMPILGFQNYSFNWGGSNVKPDITTGIGTQDAITLANNPSSVATSVGSNGGVLTTLYLTSVTPVSTNQGQVNFTLGSNITLNNVLLKFLKPFAGEIEVRNMSVGDNDRPDTWEWELKPKLGTLSDYRLVVKQKVNFSSGKYPGSTIKISNGDESEYLTGALLPYNDGGDDNILQLESKSLTNSDTETLNYSLEPTHDILFKTRINTSKKATTMPKRPGLQINKAIISYKLDNKDIKYYLGPDGNPNGLQDIATIQGNLKVTTHYPITIHGGEFLGVRVIGGIQGGGNSEFTGQKQNISSISSMETRTQIRKNAYTYINSMKSEDIVNGVRYVEGDVAISGDNLNYETLVVKNGNVVINGNLNTDNTKLLGIIVIKDGYNVSDGYEGKGNVYVIPSVQKINAIIYADGGLISIKSYNNNSVTLYKEDSTTRTQELSKQLYINGSLFTRNTIGGAVLANQTGDKYTLPGGARTESFNTALQYDLNYIRRGDLNCGSAGGVKPNKTPAECIYDEPFIIKYDPKVQTTPPKLFGTNN